MSQLQNFHIDLGAMCTVQMYLSCRVRLYRAVLYRITGVHPQRSTAGGQRDVSFFQHVGWVSSLSHRRVRHGCSEGVQGKYNRT